MTFVNNNKDEHNDHDNSPVCRVLRSYFESLQERGRVIAEQRSMAMIGANENSNEQTTL